MFDACFAEPAVIISAATGTVTKAATTAITTPASSSYADISTVKPTSDSRRSTILGIDCQFVVSFYCHLFLLAYCRYYVMYCILIIVFVYGNVNFLIRFKIRLDSTNFGLIGVFIF